MGENQIRQASILIQRLERLSADSLWAHRASGVRAALDKNLTRIDDDGKLKGEELKDLIQSGFEILEQAAKEIPLPEDDCH
jgi:hypothetical protein